MQKLQSIALVTTLGLSLAIAPTAQAKSKITKPSAPTISAISSSAVKKGKVNVKVTITLPASNGGSNITGSKVTAGGKSCTIKKTKTSCTIKSIKNDKTLIVTAKSKNINGFSTASEKVTYVAGSDSYTRTNFVTITPVASSPVATDTTISVAAIAGVTAPVSGATPVTTTTAGTGFTGTVTWSGTPTTFDFATTYTATITLTPTSGYSLAGVTANFFTVAGATSDTNSANSGVITAVFPATVATYAVGEPGPGGGIIYYVNSSGFSCGPGYTTTGSPTGGICKYLEVAPSGWNGGTDSGIVWAAPAYQGSDVTGIASEIINSDFIPSVGLGYKNSDLIVAQNGTYNATSNQYAAGAARAYINNSKTDWYLPTREELNLLCQWTHNRTQDPGITCGDTYSPSTINSGPGASGSELQSNYYWSSSMWYGSRAWSQTLTYGRRYDTVKSVAAYVRPVRAF